MCLALTSSLKNSNLLLGHLLKYLVLEHICNKFRSGSNKAMKYSAFVEKSLQPSELRFSETDGGKNEICLKTSRNAEKVLRFQFLKTNFSYD